MAIYGKYPCVKYVYYNDVEELIVVVYNNTLKEDKDEILRENESVSKVLTVAEDYNERF